MSPAFLTRQAHASVAPAPAARPASWLLPCGFLALHALMPYLLPRHAALVSLGFLVLTPLVSAWCCFRRGHAERASGWQLLGLGLTLWAAGMAMNVLVLVALGNSSGVTSLCILFFVLYGVPVVFATASPDREAWPIRMVDAALAIALGMLFFVHTFAYSTMAGADGGTGQLANMFDIENLFILVFAGARFATSSVRQTRDFFGAMVLFALLYLLSASYINHFQQDSDFGGPADLVIDVPFLALAMLARRGNTAPEIEGWRPPRRGERLVEAASPLMLPIMLLAVAAALLGSRPIWAESGFAVATVIYGLRNILAHLRNLQERDRLEQLTRIDALTGLSNRRHFDAVLQREWARARRTGQALAVLMIDIDHFKLLNDSRGHPEGDRVLREVAVALQGCATRAGDMVARYGGEEFVVIAPGANAEQAAYLGETMRAGVYNLALPSPAPAGRISVSIGLSVMAAPAETPADLLARADAALYDAKHAGRNRVHTKL